MDIIRSSDLLSSNTCFSSGIARLSGPIRDRADRVTQVCHLKRIVPEARSPNWPYGRLDRAPLSVPLVTTLGAPRRARRQLAKGGRTDRWPQTTAIRSRTILLITKGQQHEDMKIQYAEPRTTRQSSRGQGPLDRLLAQARDPGRIPRPRLASRRPGPGLPGGRRAEYTGGAWAEDRATRGRDPAPTQGPRPGWAAGSRPSASRDWPQCDKSINSPPTAAISPPPPCHPPT